MSMRDFDKRWAEMERRRNRIRRTATVIMVMSWLGLAFMIFAGGYLLLHPEAIGKFAGRVQSGYEDAPS
jgi:hypothetical protein